MIENLESPALHSENAQASPMILLPSHGGTHASIEADAIRALVGYLANEIDA